MLDRYPSDCQGPDFDAINRIAPGFGTHLKAEAALTSRELETLADELAREAAQIDALERSHEALLADRGCPDFNDLKMVN